MTICWKAVKQYFTVVLIVIQFYPVCNFGPGTVGNERVNQENKLAYVYKRDYAGVNKDKLELAW